MQSHRRKLKPTRACAPAIERVEDRTLLSGNVLVSISASGNLRVTGDSAANQVAIQASTDGLQVSSLDGTTTINGSADPFTTAQTIQNVSVSMHGGDDAVDVGSNSQTTTITGRLSIRGGSGNDDIQIQDFSSGGSANLKGGSGDDTVSVGTSQGNGDVVSIGGNLRMTDHSGDNTLVVFDSNISKDLTLHASDGANHVQVGFDAGLGTIGSDETQTAHVDVGGNLHVRARGGDEHVAVTDTSVTGDLSVKTGRGNDEVLLGAAETAANDSTDLSNENLVKGSVTVGGELFVGTHAGDDTLFSGDVTVTGKSDIVTGSGIDHLAFAPSAAGASSFGGDLTLDSGPGNDAVVIQNDQFTGSVKMRARSGDDAVWLEGNTFQSPVTVNGGSGADTFMTSETQSPNSFPAGSPTLVSLETQLQDIDTTTPQVQASFSWALGVLN